MIVLLQSRDEDGKMYQVGQVCPPVDFASEEEMEAVLGGLYDDWWESFEEGDGPDSDSEFGEWLVAEKGWKNPETSVMTFTIKE